MSGSRNKRKLVIRDKKKRREPVDITVERPGFMGGKYRYETKFSPGGSVIYTPWVKQFVKENKRIIRDFSVARRKLIEHRERSREELNRDSYAYIQKHGPVDIFHPFYDYEVQVGNLNVSQLPYDRHMNSKIFKVRIGKKVFFVKEHIPEKNVSFFNPNYDLADSQIRALQKAMEVLAESKIENVKVAQYHLAWTNEYRSFLVTDFYEGELLDDALKSGKLKEEEWELKIAEIAKVLNKEGVHDVHPQNIIIQTDGTIVLIDLRIKSKN